MPGKMGATVPPHRRKPKRRSGRGASASRKITQRKVDEMDKARRAIQEPFRRLFDLGLIGMAITSPTKGCLEVNDELCRILGYQREELLRTSWVDLTHHDDIAADLAQFDRVMAGEIDGYTLHKRWIHKDGGVVHSIMSAKCVRRAGGSVDYFVVLVQDVTEGKHAEEDLAEARFELARIMRTTTVGELAASIAHEVNQPLAAIVTNGNACLRWLSAKPPNLHEAKSALERIVRDANRAAEVIARIRTFLERGSRQRIDVDVNQVISEVIAMVQSEFRTKAVSLIRPPADLLPLARADRVQLEQVILNLMVDAIDSMRLVTDRARVLEIEAARHGEHMLRISVRDSGVGLDPEERDKIFQAFYTTKPDGLGMGLAISRSIVEAHGGRLWVTPNSGPGATFHLTLPLGTPAAA